METQSVLRAILAPIALILSVNVAFGGGSLVWEQDTISVTAEIGQKEVNAYYGFTNTSDAPITITKAQASCGCTIPSLEKDTYAPGETGKLLAKFDIGNRAGAQHKTITVETTEAKGPQSYSLTLNVDIPQLLKLKQRALLWKVGESAEPKDCEIIIHTSYPMKIESVATKNGDDAPSNFNFEIEEIEAAQKYLIRITPKSTEAKVRETCYLVSPDDKKNQLRNFPIYAWIR